MVVDSSAIIAILCNEPECESFLRAMASASTCCMSTATVLETSMVLQGRANVELVNDFDVLLVKYAIDIIPFCKRQAQIARRAFLRYGKGNHPAGLNFGDCIAYALAKDTGEPLLFKGNDFPQTDITPVPLSDVTIQ